MMCPSATMARGTASSPSSRFRIACEITVLPLPGRPVDEERVAAVDCRTELIEHALAQTSVRKASRTRLARGGLRHRLGERAHIGVVLRERHRRHAHVLTLLEEEQPAHAAGIGQAIDECGPGGQPAAG